MAPFTLVWTGNDSEIQGRFRLPNDSTFFARHFPNRPVLPGVGMLSMLDTLVRSIPGGQHPCVKRLNRVKFQRLVESGGDFTVILRPLGQKGAYEFQITFEGSSVATGRVACSDIPESLRECEATEIQRPMKINLDDLIPQRPPMRVIHGVQDIGDSGCLTFSRVDENWPMVVDNTVPSVFIIEAIAQSAAVYTGWTLRDIMYQGGRGYLVGIKQADLMVREIPVGTTFHTRLRTVLKKKNFGIYKGDVFCGDAPLGTATIQAFRASDDF